MCTHTHKLSNTHTHQFSVVSRNLKYMREGTIVNCYIETQIYSTYIYIYMYIKLHVYVHVYVYIHVHVHIHVHIYMYVHVIRGSLYHMTLYTCTCVNITLFCDFFLLHYTPCNYHSKSHGSIIIIIIC